MFIHKQCIMYKRKGFILKIADRKLFFWMSRLNADGFKAYPLSRE
ncbi:MAG: hypothetical protein ACYCTB_02960 [bacterium]